MLLGSFNYSSICVLAASGVGTSSFDQQNGATSTSSTIQTGSVTPSVNGELLITGLGWNSSRTNYPPTLNSSFTVATSSNFLSGNHYGCSIGYYVQPTAGAVNPTWDQGSSQSNSVRIATFKPATTTNSVGSTTVRYVHADHLGSTNAVTSATGTLMQTLDYYPYGASRIKSGQDVSSREYIGEVVDTTFPLSYLNARYMDSSRGQFLSQDPVFLAIGDGRTVANIASRSQRLFLADPQLLNAYSYASNNPISKKDSTGLETYDYEVQQTINEYRGRYLKEAETRFISGVTTASYVAGYAGMIALPIVTAGLAGGSNSSIRCSGK